MVGNLGHRYNLNSRFVVNWFCNRLPLYQGPTATYVVPLLALMTLPQWNCPQEGMFLRSVKIKTAVLVSKTFYNVIKSGYEDESIFRPRYAVPRFTVFQQNISPKIEGYL